MSNPEVPAIAPYELELFDGPKEALTSSTEAFEAYKQQRHEQVAAGEAVFVVDSFFKDGYDAVYFVDKKHIATIHYSTEQETLLFWATRAEGIECSLEEAMLAAKALGGKIAQQN